MIVPETTLFCDNRLYQRYRTSIYNNSYSDGYNHFSVILLYGAQMSKHKPGQPQQPENQLMKTPSPSLRDFELARNGGTHMLRPMLEAGVPVNIRTSNGESLLMLAARNGHVDTVQLLLEKGANPELQDADGNTALSLARAMGAQDVIKHLIAKPPTSSKSTACSTKARLFTTAGTNSAAFW